MTKVLIVEDNVLNRELMQDILDGNGVHWISATSGAQAIDLLRTEAVDIVLMDLQMPEMDGFQTLENIQKLLGASTPPVIAITGNAMEVDRKRCLEEGFAGFLKKPFRIQNFLEILKSHLQK